MPSFDIASKTDLQEVDNAVNSAIREIENRYDFKGCGSKYVFEKEEIIILANSDYNLKSMQEILKIHATRRKIDIKSFEFKDSEKASGGMLRQIVTIKQGIDADNARKIIKTIKESKIKVTASNRGDKIRVDGKKIDDLQAVMALLRNTDFEVPLVFENFL
jgi:uncharacterized protein YajQ (UPF0234 family)